MYWLDYSRTTLSGATIKAAGYGGVIRYIDAPNKLRHKHTTLAEYRDHKAHGLGVLLVMQNDVDDADRGWDGGVSNARRAKAGADMLGYTGPIFFTNDRTTVHNANAWKSYLDGAASVLGPGRIGAYGFGNAMDLARGHATYFWQAGRRADVRGHTHVWQDNNTQVHVGGVLCDRNLFFKPIDSSWSEQEEIMKDDERNAVISTWGAMFLGGGENPLKAGLVYEIATIKDLLSQLVARPNQAPVLEIDNEQRAKLAQEIMDALPTDLAQRIVDEQAERLKQEDKVPQ
ncbi:glycoside hydrolase domain-containing protein [Amycolatopsis nigrescens]|uniref:glycoside hydrolase domain-containing protein n=1 Tax=Amycolatopsis nigrescens TaxID=381445 RepID=UPI00036B2B5E|nr:glycoside hydrolase domain-containing protein [Amycolatopsis nigrescens]